MVYLFNYCHWHTRVPLPRIGSTRCGAEPVSRVKKAVLFSTNDYELSLSRLLSMRKLQELDVASLPKNSMFGLSGNDKSIPGMTVCSSRLFLLFRADGFSQPRLLNFRDSIWRQVKDGRRVDYGSPIVPRKTVGHSAEANRLCPRPRRIHSFGRSHSTTDRLIKEEPFNATTPCATSIAHKNE